MNVFEDIVRRYLEQQGYWVRQSVKVDITKPQKVEIGTPSMPRPEIDLVAFNVMRNELVLIEAKSYLDSHGVYYEAIADPKDKKAARYKLFTSETFQRIVTEVLIDQYMKCGLINNKVKVKYGLAAGNIHKGHEELIADYFRENKWLLITPQQLREFVEQCATKGWEDDVVTMTAKLLRNTPKN
ncbi:hypothetical protein ACFLXT_04440 [Chloroflexota bacterium]